MVRKRSKESLLTFDEDSPLFVKKKKRKKTPTKKKKEAVDSKTDEKKPVEEPTAFVTKRKRKKQQPKKLVNPDAPKYMIKSPADCKHILPVFKKKLIEVWKKLETGTSLEVGNIANYLRGVATVAKNSRPKEYEELKLLITEARQIAIEKDTK